VTAASVIEILSHCFREIAFDQESRRLHDSVTSMVSLLGGSFKRTHHANLVAAVTTIAGENRTSITLIKEDGIVVEDSERNPSTMENHAERREIVRARQTGTGSVQRLSPTLGIPMLYLAIRLGDDSVPHGYIRLSVSLNAVEAEIDFVQQLVVGTFPGVSVL
jgi:hypothetical protein